MSGHPVKAVLSLIFCFINAAGLYILLGAEYIAMTLVIVYVGAVAVLFLFVVMMSNLTSNKHTMMGWKGVVGYSLLVGIMATQITMALNHSSLPPQSIKNRDLEQNESSISISPQKKANYITQDTSNTKQIGIALYSDYMLQLQIVGLILLVAMVGAVMLIMTEKNKNELGKKVAIPIKDKQNFGARLIKVESGKGISLD